MTIRRVAGRLEILSRTLIVAAFAAGLAPAAAPARAYDHSALLDAAIATVTTDELREHAGVLADDTLEGREAGTRGGQAAARYVEVQLKTDGLAPAGDNGGYLQRFPPKYQNLLGKIPGVDPQLKNEWLLIGAHYDHVGYGNSRNSNGPVGYIHNGADDNASGVATLLEMVDALTRTHWQPRRSIVFAFWDGEEINLLGSRWWVKHPTVPLADVRLAVNIDMIGRLRQGRLEVGGTRTAPGLREMLSSERVPADMWLDFTWEYKENSDHWPLFEAGVPSLIIHTGLHEDYHTPRDDVDKLNVPGMQRGRRLRAGNDLPAGRRQRAAGVSPGVAVGDPGGAESPPGALAAGADAIGSDVDDRRGPAVAGGEGRERDAGLRRRDRRHQGGGFDHGRRRGGDRQPLAAAGRRVAPDKEVKLTVVHDGAPQDVTVPLDGPAVALGVSWREDDAEPGAVYITRVVPFSPAARAGLAVYDRIYALHGEPFADGAALLKRIGDLLAEKPDTLEVEVETAGHLRTVAVDLRLPTTAGDATL